MLADALEAGLRPWEFGRLTWPQWRGIRRANARDRTMETSGSGGAGTGAAGASGSVGRQGDQTSAFSEAKRRLKARTGRTAFGLAEVWDEMRRGA